MIKAILFDMVGPLLQKRPDYVEDEIINKAEELYRESANNEEHIEKLSSNPLTKNYSLEEIANKVANKYCKIPQVWEEVLPKLKDKYLLAIINNGMGFTVPFFKEKNNFAELFEFFINSTEEGIKKPDPRIYLMACKRLGVKPEECIFIDDTKRCVQGAKDVGMQAIQYQTYAQFVKDLKSLGIS